MKVIYITLLVVLTGVFSTTSICRPELLATNEFVGDFLKHDVLAIMAVIMTIAIASIATIHIWFNELEAKHERRIFGAARREINHDAFILIWLFIGEFGLLAVRYYCGDSKVILSFFNGAAIVVFLSSVITLIDVMNVVRALTPDD
jgi:hypothetical protein